jgi:cobalt/nickel transport system permease protein
MHIPDGFLSPLIFTLMYALSLPIIILCWKKSKKYYSQSFTPLLAISSAFVFAAQMINFPITYGTSGHLVGGTFLSIILGPYAAVLSMTIVLLMQAFFFADGGLLAFGANAFNLAIIGGLSFFIIKLLVKNPKNKKILFTGVFIASWLSVILGALSCSLQIGFSLIIPQGILYTIPTMLGIHAIIGVGEGIITATLASQLHRIQPGILRGLSILRGGKNEKLL